MTKELNGCPKCKFVCYAWHRGYDFCPDCGTKLEVHCSCFFYDKSPSDPPFCPYCGKATP
jgi:hypothetical protein